MMKKIALTVGICLILTLGCAGCGKETKKVEKHAQETAEAITKGDVKEVRHIIFGKDEAGTTEKGKKTLELEEIFQEEDDEILNEIFDRSSLKVNKIEEDKIEYEIETPELDYIFNEILEDESDLPEDESNLSGDENNISGDDAVEDDSADDIKEYIKKAKLKKRKIWVYYTIEDGEIIIRYRDKDFLNAITGGLLESRWERRQRYRAYAELLESYEDRYGMAKVYEESEYYSYMTGVCFVKLVDFEHNGKEQLLLAFERDVEFEFGTEREYYYEVWDYQDREMVMLDSGAPYGGEGGLASVILTEVEGKKYLVTGRADWFGRYIYHGYTDGEVGIAKEIEWNNGENGEEEYLIDGEPVSAEVLEREQEKWFSNAREFSLNYDCDKVLKQNERTKRRLYPYYSFEKAAADEKESGERAPKNDEKILEEVPENSGPMSADEIYEKLVEHYRVEAEADPESGIVVMEGELYDNGQYGTIVRCGVPGNPDASQMLYDIVVDAATGEVTQTRAFDNQVVTYYLR